jgi:hypothetical protein
MAFFCGVKKDHTHNYAFQGRACHQGNLHACTWLVLVDTEDGPQARDCGADAVYDDDGFFCEKGHSHVKDEVRVAQGWDYAGDPGEAVRMQGFGITPMLMDGTGPYYYNPVTGV